MNKFVKKNMMLLIVSGITLIVALILAYMAVREHSAMQDYIRETDTLKNQIKDLIKQKPAPVEGNLDRIKNDTQKYKNKFKEIRVLFGMPLYPAMSKFAKDMGSNFEEFQAKFATFWESNKASGVTRDQVYRMFKNSYNNPEKWDKAIQDFTVEAQKCTSELIDENNVDEILLSGLGLERNLSGSKVKCDAFMRGIRWKLLDLYTADKDKKIEFGPTASSFSFDSKSLPDKEAIPFIVKCWTAVDDLAKRIAGSGITYLESFEKESLAGRVVGNYTFYRFTIIVQGDLNSIRKLIDILYKAYSERRIYIVRGISLAKVNDDAERLIMEAERTLYAGKINLDENPELKPAQSPADGPPDAQKQKEKEQRLQEQKKKDKADEDPEKNIPYYQRSTYGKVIIGTDKQCRAVIDLDYVVYTALDLKG
ncbi:MAG: hypothetical protein WCV67_00490 [Victivallaceae bacterium]|jgi:hypothetical protein